MVLLICVYSKKRPGDFVAFGIVGAFSLRLESSERFRMSNYFKEFEYSED